MIDGNIAANCAESMRFHLHFIFHFHMANVEPERGYSPRSSLSKTARENKSPNGTVMISIHQYIGVYTTTNIETMSKPIAVAAYSTVGCIWGPPVNLPGRWLFCRWQKFKI